MTAESTKAEDIRKVALWFSWLEVNVKFGFLYFKENLFVFLMSQKK